MGQFYHYIKLDLVIFHALKFLFCFQDWKIRNEEQYETRFSENAQVVNRAGPAGVSKSKRSYLPTTNIFPF